MSVMTPHFHFKGQHMNYEIRRIGDAESFAYLDTAPIAQPKEAKTLFGMTASFLVYDALTTFSSDLTLLIPNIPEYPVEYGYVFTSGGERLFCYVVIRKEVELRQAIIFEVHPIVLMLPTYGLRTTNGRAFPMQPLTGVLAPDDDKPITFNRIDPEGEAYIAVREGVPETASWVASSSQRQPQGTNATAVPSGNSKKELVPIYFELGATCFPAMRINGDAALMKLSKIGGPNE